MPRYEGAYFLCPICGRKTQETSTSRGGRTFKRYACPECWNAALSELALKLILEDPVTPEEREQRAATLVQGTVLEHQESCGAPQARKESDDRYRDRIYEWLNEPRNPPSPAKTIDRALSQRSGTAARLLPAMREHGDVVIAGYRRGSPLWLSWERWESDEFRTERLKSTK